MVINVFFESRYGSYCSGEYTIRYINFKVKKSERGNSNKELCRIRNLDEQERFAYSICGYMYTEYEDYEEESIFNLGNVPHTINYELTGILSLTFEESLLIETYQDYINLGVEKEVELPSKYNQQYFDSHYLIITVTKYPDLTSVFQRRGFYEVFLSIPASDAQYVIAIEAEQKYLTGNKIAPMEYIIHSSNYKVSFESTLPLDCGYFCLDEEE